MHYFNITCRPEVQDLERWRRLRRIEQIVNMHKLPPSAVQNAHQDHRRRRQQKRQILDSGLDIAKLRTCLPLLPKLSRLVNNPSEEGDASFLNFPLAFKYHDSHAATEAAWKARAQLSLETQVSGQLYIADVDMNFTRAALSQVLKVMPSMSCWQQPVELEIYLHKNLVDDRAFGTMLHGDVFQRSMRCIKHLSIGVMEGDMDDVTGHRDMAAILYRILDCAKNLERLVLNTSYLDTCQKVLTTCYLPKLRNFSMLNSAVFCPRGHFMNEVWNHCSPVTTVKFLLRHKDTLSHVALRQWAVVPVAGVLTEGRTTAAPGVINFMQKVLMAKLHQMQTCNLRVNLPSSDDGMWAFHEDDMGSILLYGSSDVYLRLLRSIRASPHGRFRPTPIGRAVTANCIDLGFERAFDNQRTTPKEADAQSRKGDSEAPAWPIGRRTGDFTGLVNNLL